MYPYTNLACLQVETIKEFVEMSTGTQAFDVSGHAYTTLRTPLLAAPAIDTGLDKLSSQPLYGSAFAGETETAIIQDQFLARA